MTYPVDARGYAADPEMEAYLGLCSGRLRKLRHLCDAPQFIRIGRSVRTSYAAADEWAAKKCGSEAA